MERRRFLKSLSLGVGAATLGEGLPVIGADVPKKCSCQACGQAVALDHKTPVEAMYNSQKARNGVAIGGIGAGSAELRQDGIFYNWTIFNNLPLGTGKLFPFAPDSMLFFIVRYQIAGQEPRMKALLINNKDEDLAGIDNYAYIYPWLTPVEKIETVVQFPFVRLRYIDAEMPVEVEMEVFSPFIPGDVKNSSLPAMLFRFKVKSKIDRPVTVTLAANYRTGAGYDHREKLYTSEIRKRAGYTVHSAGVEGIAAGASSFGAQALASLAEDTTWRAGWGHIHLHYEQFLRSAELPNTDTTSPPSHHRGINVFNRKLNKVNAQERCYSTLAVTRQLGKGESFEHDVVHCWHFPNLYNDKHDRVEGHYYSNFFHDAWEVADYVVTHRDELRRKSRAFVDDFFDSTLDPLFLNQVNSHLNTFITSGWLTRQGDFGILEGMNCNDSCCGLATIDVGVYGTPLIVSLFPELQKASMRLHRDRQQADGRVAHSYMKDLNHQIAEVPDLTDRLDVSMQYAGMVLRDFMWTNDRQYLQEMWPSVKKAMGYMLGRDRDGDQMPDMEGIMCSYDNFPMYGLASYIQSQWLYTLAQCVEAAKALGDPEAATLYGGILEKGKRLLDDKLWNGRYFRLYRAGEKLDLGGKAGKAPIPPIDEGCLTDQIIGQWLAHMSGLGYFASPKKVKAALGSVLEMSRTADVGLRNCTWPGDKFLHDIPPEIWVDQANTPWTGVELAFASFLIYEGMVKEGMQVVRSVDERYRRAGLYWNHQECGGHYYRAMSAWTLLHALLGLSINQTRLGFAPKMEGNRYKVLFALNGATAHYIRHDASAAIDVRSGQIELWTLALGKSCGVGKRPAVKLAGQPVVPPPALSREGETVVLDFGKTLRLAAGTCLEIG